MTKFDNVEAVILDKDGVFNNFHTVWLRIIAYRAQLIAEKVSATSEMLVKVRTACIRAMGVDEEDEHIDPYGPCSMPLANVRLALATAVYLTVNETEPSFNWTKAFLVVDEVVAETKLNLNVVEMSESFPGVLEKISEIGKSGCDIAIFTSDNLENTKGSLKKFGIDKYIKAIQAGEYKTSEIYTNLCKEIGVKPSQTLMVSDSPHDITIAKAVGAKTLLVLTGMIPPEANTKIYEGVADEILNSLADLQLGQSKTTKKKVTV